LDDERRPPSSGVGYAMQDHLTQFWHNGVKETREGEEAAEVGGADVV
jgi:hypothetical protein